jgi:hypothetical protein
MAVSYPLEFTQAPVTSGILAALFVNDFLALAIRPATKLNSFFRAGLRDATPKRAAISDKRNRRCRRELIRRPT